MGSRICPLVWGELLDDGGRLAGSASHDVVSSLHGGRLLSVFCVWQPDSIESAPTAAYQPSTKLGTPSFFEDDFLSSKIKGHVNSIQADRSGNLWFGCDDGLICLRNGIVKRYTAADGLTSTEVRIILEDRRGTLWIGTAEGLSSLKNNHFFPLRAMNGWRFGVVEALYEDATNHFDSVWAAGWIVQSNFRTRGQPGGFKAQDGKLWFATQRSVIIVDPKAVPFDSSPPPVKIEECTLEQQPVPCRSELRIKPGLTNLKIQYTALSFIRPEEFLFKYRLEGLGDSWTDAGNRRTAY
ncbi:MAG TPA: two-component regulator propeller domain-containing protein [Terriglobia bacterium]|nr:two-component regulator propeller domain-containing protein [Terriglobia bacterium]